MLCSYSYYHYIITAVRTVDAPRCGVHTRLGCAINTLRCSLGGSEVNTSKAAPATLPD